MELFDKIYNCYFQIISQILKEASAYPIKSATMQEICDQYGFLESGIAIIPKLMNGTWDFLEEQENNHWLSKIIQNEPIPLTLLQKSWIKALLFDPRFQLFFTAEEYQLISDSLMNIEPLYEQSDFYYFDQYLDGDCYEDHLYREHFRKLLSAVKSMYSVKLIYQSPKKGKCLFEFLPCRIQFSEKDNKFRVLGIQIADGRKKNRISINISRIIHLVSGNFFESTDSSFDIVTTQTLTKNPIVIEISGKRNSLERCLLQFSSYQKQTMYDEERDCYICKIFYHKEDEAELLIQILSFGPVIKVLEPKEFLNQVKDRIKKQYLLISSSF